MGELRASLYNYNQSFCLDVLFRALFLEFRPAIPTAEIFHFANRLKGHRSYQK